MISYQLKKMIFFLFNLPSSRKKMPLVYVKITNLINFYLEY